MPSSSPVTIAISRFDDLLALGLQTALESDPSVSVIARDVSPARLESVLRVDRPQVLILDVGTLRDYVQVREIRLGHPDTCVVLLGHGLSSVDSAQLLAFGASACLATDTQVRDLTHAIHLASRGLQLQALPLSMEARATEPLLTGREGDVLGLLRQNRSNAQIALALGIGVETVRSHARSIYRKLGVSSRRTLLALAEAPPAPASAPEPNKALARRHAGSRPVTRRPQHH
jgi:DNA-binding NarL/FixJ family response regulator